MSDFGEARKAEDLRTGAMSCRVVEADFEKNLVTLEMSGDYAVSMGEYLLIRAHYSAALSPPVPPVLDQGEAADVCDWHGQSRPTHSWVEVDGGRRCTHCKREEARKAGHADEAGLDLAKLFADHAPKAFISGEETVALEGTDMQGNKVVGVYSANSILSMGRAAMDYSCRNSLATPEIMAKLRELSTPVSQPDTAVRAPQFNQAEFDEMTRKGAVAWAGVNPSDLRGAPTLTAAPDTGADERYPPGYVLAMRVLQSDLYETLDDIERADCDELIARHITPLPDTSAAPQGAGNGPAPKYWREAMQQFDDINDAEADWVEQRANELAAAKSL